MDPADADRPLPRGRHGLTAAVVEASQRQRLCTAAVQTVAVNGFADAAVGPIVAAARVSRHTLYYLYSSKEDLVWEAVEDVCAQLETSMLAALRGPDDPLQAARDALEIHVRRVRDDVALARCLAYLRRSAPAQVEARLAEGEDRLAAAMNDRLRLGTAMAGEGVVRMYLELVDRRVLRGELTAAALVPAVVCDLLARAVN